MPCSGQLGLHPLRHRLECRGQTGNIGTAALGHNRPAATLASQAGSKLAHQVAGFHLVGQDLGNTGGKRDLAIVNRR